MVPTHINHSTSDGSLPECMALPMGSDDHADQASGRKHLDLLASCFPDIWRRGNRGKPCYLLASCSWTNYLIIGDSCQWLIRVGQGIEEICRNKPGKSKSSFSPAGTSPAQLNRNLLFQRHMDELENASSNWTRHKNYYQVWHCSSRIWLSMAFPRQPNDVSRERLVHEANDVTLTNVASIRLGKKATVTHFSNQRNAPSTGSSWRRMAYSRIQYIIK